MAVKMSVLRLILSSNPYLRSAMVRFPLYICILLCTFALVCLCACVGGGLLILLLLCPFVPVYLYVYFYSCICSIVLLCSCVRIYCIVFIVVMYLCTCIHVHLGRYANICTIGQVGTLKRAYYLKPIFV